VTPSEAVEQKLRARLETMKKNEAFPPVRTLSKLYGVSVATVERAFDRLKAENLISSRPGWGVFKV
jgi:DNA-binding GntR family transcriptional regulator